MPIYDYGDLSPTDRVYAQLQDAYEFFNGSLFNNKLCDCLITLQRRRRTGGYFAYRRFRDPEHDNIRVHELALNPDYAAQISIEEFLSVLVHEMCHCWRAQDPHCPMREMRGYHSRAWANKMIELGLIPSHSGKIGGKQTGDKMSHYIHDEGSFVVATAELLAHGWRFDLVDGRAWLNNPGVHEEKRKNHKRCYVCPKCDARVWGRPELQLGCLVCELALSERQ